MSDIKKIQKKIEKLNNNIMKLFYVNMVVFLTAPFFIRFFGGILETITFIIVIEWTILFLIVFRIALFFEKKVNKKFLFRVCKKMTKS